MHLTGGPFFIWGSSHADLPRMQQKNGCASSDGLVARCRRQLACGSLAL